MEWNGDAGKATISGRRLGSGRTAAKASRSSGTRTAHSKPGETGVRATTNTAARQIQATSLRGKAIGIIIRSERRFRKTHRLPRFFDLGLAWFLGRPYGWQRGSIKVLKGDPILVTAVMKAVKQWRWK